MVRCGGFNGWGGDVRSVEWLVMEVAHETAEYIARGVKREVAGGFSDDKSVRSRSTCWVGDGFGGLTYGVYRGGSPSWFGWPRCYM